ncbi:hypothetical protein DL766_000212 [Monosporascus sp. MC13-8B]|uniref:Uncharacterized protein n=1 Tax=Monosporascus cannonballus TaxID=155416 RepID=A0ABY0H1Q5_9PEZI|nr:hypothetical protein DL762_006528 [Monosporascus cannonballus]RYO83764.1 hypothetical protein DL763_007727 [Monosporascus cannonballus]RYP39770.1 hypothetical protein DL766_000212 [Monosporascus sp. MC13-8B]
MTASENITVALVGTCDTKLQELLCLKRLILEAGASSVILIDIGLHRVQHEGIDVSRDKTPAYAAHREAELTKADRGGCIKIITECASHYVQSLYEEGKIHGIISAGGSGGTTLTAPVMREALPIGFPKLIVSTIASGDTGPLVGESDVTMMYSVVDIAGSNTLLNRIFSNASGAIVGMARAWASSAKEDSKKQKKKVGITMFGVTTPCVNIAREVLESKYGCECFIFHATGHGGRSLERLVEAGQLDAVLDVTTTEVCDHLMGGNMSAGETRLEAAPKAGIPYVVSVGATDMVNFGPRATVPDKYSNRQLYQHNSMVTLMRTTAEECEMVGDFIAKKLRRFALDQKRVKVVLPKGGVSMIATPGAPFAAAEADRATFEAIVSGLQGTDIEVIERNEAINEEEFAQGIANTLAAMLSA